MNFKTSIRPISNIFIQYSLIPSRCMLSTPSNYEFLTFSKKNNSDKRQNSFKTQDIQSIPNSYDAIIVGGGLAGLTAAGASVLVLEARERLGGRIHSTNCLGGTIDLGASWIHGLDKNPLCDILPQKRMHFMKSNQIRSLDNGKALSTQNTGWLLEKVNDLHERILAASKKDEQDISLREFIENDIQWQRDVRTNALSSDYLPRLIHMFENVEGASLEELSIKEYNIDTFKGDHGYIMDGYSQIINELSKPLLNQENKIKLNQIVKNIEYSVNGVTVTTDKGVFYGSKCLVTLPLGYLKKHHYSIFKPAISLSKQISIENINMGLLNKIAIRFKKIWWPKDPDTFYMYSKELPNSGFIWMINQYKINKEPILVFHVASHEAIMLENMSNDEIVALIVRTLRRNFKDHKIAEPMQSVVTRWGKDVYSLGSYSHLRVGPGSKEDFGELSKPLSFASDQGEINVLYFAGEHTAKNHFALAHGAYLSGKREGNRILQDLKTHNPHLFEEKATSSRLEETLPCK